MEEMMGHLQDNLIHCINICIYVSKFAQDIIILVFLLHQIIKKITKEDECFSFSFPLLPFVTTMCVCVRVIQLCIIY